jgi:hypothetical protein
LGHNFHWKDCFPGYVEENVAVKRATQLETELRQALDDFTKNRKDSTTLNLSAIPHLTPLSVHSNYLTEFYASATLIYLHAIVSGAYPELPEIRENVRSTMELLKKLPSPILPRVMWWHILIAGSMALEDEQLLCRNLIYGAGINNSSLGTDYNILKTLEECWKRRQINDHLSQVGDGYWADVMCVQFSIYCFLLEFNLQTPGYRLTRRF